MLDPSVILKDKDSFSPIGRLLRVAADNIGKKDHDISQYEARLEKDWYTKTEELKSMTVDVLARYMPRRMADEVHRTLALELKQEQEGCVVIRLMLTKKFDGEKRVSCK